MDRRYWPLGSFLCRFRTRRRRTLSHLSNPQSAPPHILLPLHPILPHLRNRNINPFLNGLEIPVTKQSLTPQHILHLRNSIIPPSHHNLVDRRDELRTSRLQDVPVENPHDRRVVAYGAGGDDGFSELFLEEGDLGGGYETVFEEVG